MDEYGVFTEFVSLADPAVRTQPLAERTPVWYELTIKEMSGPKASRITETENDR